MVYNYRNRMRRALALFLLAVLSFPLIAAGLYPSADAQLPACCRRDGRHHCAMSDESERMAQPSSGPAVRANQPKCPYYPAATSITGDPNVAILRDSPAILYSLVHQAPALVHAAPRYRIPFSRTRQKRGPPAPLA